MHPTLRVAGEKCGRAGRYRIRRVSSLPAVDPLFAAPSKGQALTMAAGPWQQQVPLNDIGNKGERFSAPRRKH
jgi:hypothetical protein